MPTIPEQIWAHARQIATRPLVRRAYRFEDIAPAYLDTRAAALTGNRREFFALSMSDFFQAWELAETLPLLTVAARDCPDQNLKAELRAHLHAQLDEVATWKKLNRPGWTLYASGPSVAPDYNDGNWLGTGYGLRAIADALRAAGDTIPGSMRAKLLLLMQQEVAGVQDDFATRRPWFWNTPISNQFVLPNTGVIMAVLQLGKEANATAYEFAIENVLRSLDAQGRDGAHHEGAWYGPFTTKEILHAALAMAERGDRRLIKHPHLARFGDWLLHLLQPGNHVVNIHDGADRVMDLQTPDMKSGSPQPPRSVTLLDSLLLCAMADDRPDLCGAITRLFPRLYPSALSLRYIQSTKPPFGSLSLPDAFAAFTSSPLVTWRNGWHEEADGVWVRGGSSADDHDHRDHGHVNYIVGGREVLIEAGSSDYAKIMETPEPYQGGLGHNVLQIGKTAAGAQLKGRDTPIVVRHLDKNGGEVVVDGTGSYAAEVLKDWRRRVIWDKAGLQVEDTVALAGDKADFVLFRWHLADDTVVTIIPGADAKTVQITWPGGALSLEADAPLEVTTAKLPHGITWNRRGWHLCLLVQSQEPVTGLRLATRLRAADCNRTHDQKGSNPNAVENSF